VFAVFGRLSNPAGRNVSEACPLEFFVDVQRIVVPDAAANRTMSASVMILANVALMPTASSSMS
jgi:hypothetical protein